MFSGKRVYFLGIGGIGMSALAKHIQHIGYQVSGYDKTETEITKSLIQCGIPVFYDVDITHLQGVSTVIYTPAIPSDHTEFVYCQANNIPCYKRSEVIGWISAQYQTIAVAGTHGKTTVCSMITTLLRESGIDCSAFVGGIMLNYNTNYLSGSSPYLVVEADEYDRSFLTLSPKYAVVTATDADHLDIYQTHKIFLSTMSAFAGRITQKLITTPAVWESLPEKPRSEVLIYGQTPQSDIRCINLRPVAWGTYFDYEFENCCWKNLFLPIPGTHNVLNATAAIIVARELGISEEQVRTALAAYQGVKRRYELRYAQHDIFLIDDYAHHPEELRAVIEASRRQFPDYRLMVIFQPHLYTRTRDFADKFAEVLSAADEVIITPIYPARELSIPNVSSELIYQQIYHEHRHNVTLPSLTEVFMRLIKPKSVCLLTGAGDIDGFIPDMIHALKAKFEKPETMAL